MSDEANVYLGINKQTSQGSPVVTEKYPLPVIVENEMDGYVEYDASGYNDPSDKVLLDGVFTPADLRIIADEQEKRNNGK